MEKEEVSRTFNIVSEIGLIFLIIFIPLALGSVQFWSTTLMEVMILLLAIFWFLKTPISSSLFVKPPINIFLLLFLALILFQLFPLPPWVIKGISINTYNLYNPITSDYSLTKVLFKHWRSLSIYPHLTLLEFFKSFSLFGLFFLIVNNIRTARQTNRIILVIILIGFFQAVYGLLEYFSGHQWTSFFKRNTYPPDRITGTFTDKNHFAYYLGIVIPFSLGFLIVHIHRLSFIKFKSWWVRILTLESQILKVLSLSLIIISISLAIFLSGSIIGIIGLTLSIFFMATMWIFKRHKRFLIISIFIMGLILLPGIGKGSQVLSQKGRLGQWQQTINLIKDFPLLGTGWGTYALVFPRYKILEDSLNFSHAHNDYLEIISETGLIGFAILIFGTGVFFWQIVKMWFKSNDYYIEGVGLGGLSACLAVFLYSLVDSNLYLLVNVSLLIVIMGLSWSLLSQEVDLKGNPL